MALKHQELCKPSARLHRPAVHLLLLQLSTFKLVLEGFWCRGAGPKAPHKPSHFKPHSAGVLTAEVRNLHHLASVCMKYLHGSLFEVRGVLRNPCYGRVLGEQQTKRKSQSSQHFC
jgi:hypothetical protein